MRRYPAIEIAKYFLHKASEEGKQDGELSSLKLQKMLYFAQAHFLDLFDQPLFEDPIEAWKFGPVVPNVYNELKRFPATQLISKIGKLHTSNVSEDNDPIIIKFLDEVYTLYIQYSAQELVSTTHTQDPWVKAYANRQIDNRIYDMDLKEYYGRYTRK